jgi:Na+/H+ antiporter NhaA
VSTVAAERSAWTRNLAEPLRAFLRAETASAACLAGAALAAIVWATIDQHSYERVWETVAAIDVGGHGVELTLRDWVNAGLMSFFFFVVGLEARREIDVGELRERRRIVLPLAAAAVGMATAVAVYLAATAGTGAEHAWGIAMSTDTAITLGALALLGKQVPDRLRAYVVAILVFDDLLALAVLVLAYSSDLELVPLLVAAVLFAVVLGMVRIGIRGGAPYLAIGIVIWGALLDGGVEPVVVGIAFGLLTFARPAGWGELQNATDLFRLFREQPTPELARAARRGVEHAVSPNDRLQALFLPWTSYLIVPLFAFANAGVHIDADSVASRIALAIVLAYVVGKPLGIALVTAVVSRVAPRLRPPVGWLSVVAGGAAAGSAFTISLLIATIALEGDQLESAKVGVIGAAILAPATAWVIARAGRALPLDLRLRAVLGRAESMVDLAVAVDEGRDHVRGPEDASVTLVEYGDFECPYCGRAEDAIEEVLGGGGVRYVWRHLPLTDVHPHAQFAAEASEAAHEQGRFWQMHDMLLDHQGALEVADLIGYAEELGLDVERFLADLRRHAGGKRIADDVESAELSGVSGTPTFFVNGRRHWGAYDAAGLTRAVKEARARARVAATPAADATRRTRSAVPES